MKTFLVAEAGINHNGDLQVAKDMVEVAKECGCDAVKFQTYQTDRRVTKDNPDYDILKQCELTYEQQDQIKKHADKIGIEFFSTPFDEDALNFLVNLGVKKIKVSSFDVTNIAFLDKIGKVARENRIDVIMSTGMADYSQIDFALLSFPSNHYIYDVTLLHCVSAYPINDRDANLSAIHTLRTNFIRNHYLSPVSSIGYSDHSSGIDVAAASVFFGATMIEKHFTLDLNGPCVDNPVSADPKMIKDLIKKSG